MLVPVLKVINLFLGLAAFLMVGAISLSAGDGLLWAVGKAIISFVVCWIVLGWLATLICYAVHGRAPEVSRGEKGAQEKKPIAAKGK